VVLLRAGSKLLKAKKKTMEDFLFLLMKNEFLTAFIYGSET